MRSSENRKRTPPAFAEWLVELAAGAKQSSTVSLSGDFLPLAAGHHSASVDEFCPAVQPPNSVPRPRGTAIPTYPER